MEAIFQTQDKKKHNQESVERNTSHNYKKIHGTTENTNNNKNQHNDCN